MEVDGYRCFVAVVETGSFTRAGERLGVGQSAVSQQIRRLEQRCGRQLLHRDTQSVRMTPEGEALLPYAVDLQRAFEDAEVHLREPPLIGTVRVGVAEDFAGSRLPELLGRFRRFHAGVRLQVETGLSGDLSDRLDRGDFDLVVSKRADPKQGGKVIFTEPLEWAVGPQHLDLARQRSLPLALHPRPSVTAEAVMAALRAAGVATVVVLTSPSIAGLRAGVHAGLGISAFGRRFMPQGLLPMSASALGLPPLPSLEFGLERRQGNLSAVVEALADVIERGVLGENASTEGPAPR